jgi:hypothetical protein
MRKRCIFRLSVGYVPCTDLAWQNLLVAWVDKTEFAVSSVATLHLMTPIWKNTVTQLAKKEIWTSELFTEKTTWCNIFA